MLGKEHLSTFKVLGLIRVLEVIRVLELVRALGAHSGAFGPIWAPRLIRAPRHRVRERYGNLGGRSVVAF